MFLRASEFIFDATAKWGLLQNSGFYLIDKRIMLIKIINPILGVRDDGENETKSCSQHGNSKGSLNHGLILFIKGAMMLDEE